MTKQTFKTTSRIGPNSSFKQTLQKERRDHVPLFAMSKQHIKHTHIST